MRTESSVLTVPVRPKAYGGAGAGLFSLILLSFGHFFIDMYSSALGAFQPLLVAKLHLSLKQAGVVGGVMILFSSVMQPAYGYLSDRLHTRLFSALAPAVAGIFIASLGLAPNYWILLLMVALGGAGIASFRPQASAWAAAAMETNRSRWMAVFISAGTLGMAFGPTVFSTLLTRYGLGEAHWGALPGIVATIVLLFWLPAGKVPEHRGRRSVDWEPLKRVWKPLTILYFLVFFRSAVQLTFAQFLPLYLQRERGYSLSDSNYALSAYLAAGALGGFVGGHLADKFGGRLVILMSFVLSVPALLIFFFTGGLVSTIGLVLGGLTLLFTIPVNVVMAQDLAPGQAGTVSALMMGFSWGMSGILFVPLTGLLSDMYSMNTAILCLLIMPAMGILLTLRLPKDAQ